MTPEEEIFRANQAAQVLNNEIYKEAFQLMRAQYVQAFVQSKFGEENNREFIWHGITNLNHLEKQLESVMVTGKMAKITIDQPKSQE